MKRTPKTLTALALALAAALVLAGCGGGDDDSTTTAPGAGAETTRQARAPGGAGTTPKQSGADKQGAGEQGGGEKRSGDREDTPSAAPSELTGPSPTPSGTLPNEGTRALAPGVQLAKGGDNSIQTYGVEAPAADRVEAARIAKAYLEARAAGRYSEACSYLSTSIKAQLSAFAGGGEAVDCPASMRALTDGVPQGALDAAAEIEVLSMRSEGGARAFLLYTDGTGTPTFYPMLREGGVWKAAAIAGSALVL